MRKSLLVLFILTLLVGSTGRSVLADPSLPLPYIPICGDQDGSETPFTYRCPDFVPSTDVQTFQVPGTGSVSLRFDFVYRAANYDNELGYFTVDSASGAIGTLRPGESGYMQAVLQKATIIFPSGSTAYTPDVTLTLTGGDILVFFIVQGNTLDRLLTNNPTNEYDKRPLAFFGINSLNPDNVDHFVGFENTSNNYTQFGFEDITGGGDFDYDDIVYNISPPLTPLTGQIDLDPANTNVTLDQSHTLTASISGQSGVPLAGVAVTFTVIGINPQTYSATTDAAGKAVFTYKSSRAGQDAVVASATIGDKNIKSNSAVVSWVTISNSVDIGFRPNPDGYKFDNYLIGEGYIPGVLDFTAEDAVRMLGTDQVCGTIIGPVCIAKPQAAKWIAGVNYQMATGGHCVGMSVTSLRFFKELDKPSQYQAGAQVTYDLNLANVRKHIAYYHAEQGLFDNDLKASERQTLTDTMNSLISSLKTEPMLLFIRGYTMWGISGHAIAPFAIEDRGDGRYLIRVYDNAVPNEDNRFMFIDTHSNSWSYEMADGTAWGSNALQNSLAVLPLSKFAPSFNNSSCAWCGDFGTVYGSTGQVWLTGKGHLLITDSQGRRIGYAGNQLIDEIPDADVQTIYGGVPNTSVEPVYKLPLSDTYTVLLDGQTLTQTEKVNITQFGPGYAASVDDAQVQSRSRDQLTFAPDGTQVTYHASQAIEPTLSLAMSDSNMDYLFQIQHADIGTDQIVKVSVDTTLHRLAFSNAQAGGGRYNLEIQRVSAAGEQNFTRPNITIAAGDTHYFDYGAWDGSSTIPLLIDHGSDGTIDETFQLSRQLQVYLPLITEPGNAPADVPGTPEPPTPTPTDPPTPTPTDPPTPTPTDPPTPTPTLTPVPAPTPPLPNARLYVTNGKSNSVAIVDTASNAIVGTIPIGAGAQGIAAKNDGSRVYSADSAANQVSVIDPAQQKVVATIPVGEGPVIPALSSGNRLYVTNYASNSVTVINTPDNKVITTLSDLQSGPWGVAVSPDKAHIAVTLYAAGKVMIYTTTDFKKVTEVAVGIAPEGIIYHPDGSKIYVANLEGNSISIIDANTYAVSTTPVSRPAQFAFNADGSKLYVASDGASVSEIDVANNTVLRTFAVGAGPRDVEVVDSYLYVTNYDDNTLSVVSLESGAVVATIQGFDGPHSIARQ